MGLQATVTALADMDLFEAVGTLAISGHRYIWSRLLDSMKGIRAVTGF